MTDSELRDTFQLIYQTTSNALQASDPFILLRAMNQTRSLARVALLNLLSEDMESDRQGSSYEEV